MEFDKHIKYLEEMNKRIDEEKKAADKLLERIKREAIKIELEKEKRDFNTYIYSRLALIFSFVYLLIIIVSRLQ